MIAVFGWKVTVNSAFDFLAFGHDRDRLRHPERAARHHVHSTLEKTDAFLGKRCGRDGKRRQQRREKKQPEPDTGHQKSTFGTARSVASSISKNSASLNLKMLAIRLLGKDSTRTFQSRTVPL